MSPIASYQDNFANQAVRVRYAKLIAGLLRTARRSGKLAHAGTEIQVVTLEAGVVFADVVLDRLVPPSVVAVPPVVRDRLGQTRPLYRPVLQYFLARAGMSVDVGEVTLSNQRVAENGDIIAAAAWQALALSAAGGDAAKAFESLADQQGASGDFLRTTPRDNPETHWFHELVILHALASFAISAKRDDLRPAISKAVRFHVEETQADHATNQPWGLPAFLLERDGLPMADGLLHAATAHAAIEGAGGPTGLTLMLLADALYCLQRLGIPHE